MTMNDTTSTPMSSGSTVLDVDPDLESMMADLLAHFSGPTVEPDAEAVWSALSEVGIARLTGPEETGGSGAGWAEAATLLRLSAAAGVEVPYAETDLIVGPLRRAAGMDDSVTGTATLAVLGAGGLARAVPWAGSTDSVICVRKMPGSGSGPARFEVAEVVTSRVEVAPVEGISAVPMGDVALPSGGEWSEVGADSVVDAIRRGALARAVQCVGAAEGILDAAITHSTTRTQFGRALADFQSVQNMVVDIAAETMLARAAVDQAVADAIETDFRGPLTGSRVAVARSVVSRTLAVAVRNVHQVHGALGTTHEHPLHRLTLPALQWRGEFGSAALWESALADAAITGGKDVVWPMVVEGAPVEDVAAVWLDRVSG